jgi:ADP-heptose:LPS heptosyltransferase
LLPKYFRDGRLALWLRSRAAAKHSADLLLAPVRSPDKSLHAFARGVRTNARYGISGDLSNQTLEDAEFASRYYTGQLQVAPGRRWVHELEITRDFLRALDIEVTLDDIWPEVWTDDADRTWAANTIGRTRNTCIVGISPGAVVPAEKAYPADKYADVFRALPDIPLRVVLFGTATERSLCEDVARSIGQCRNVSAVSNLAGRSTVRQLVESLRLCDVVLGAETAPLHIATALRKPTVGIMGGGHYGRFYPWGNSAVNRVANLPMDCYGCNWRCRYSTIRCVQEIPPTTVAAELAIAMAHVSNSVEIGR